MMGNSAADRRGLRLRRKLEAAAFAVILLALIAGPLSLVALAELGESDSDIPLAHQVAASAEELDNLRQRIGAHRSRLEELRDREQAASESADELAQEIGLTKTLLAGLSGREVILQRQRDSLQVRLEEHNERFTWRRKGLALRLRSLYKRGAQHRWQRILTARSVSELVTQLRFQSLVANLDARLVDETRRQAELVARENQHLQSALIGIWEAREEANQQRARLELMEAERLAVLRELQQESRRAESDLRRLEAREQQMQTLLSELADARRQAESREGSAGEDAELEKDLDWPAGGEVVSGFGRNVHPAHGTITVSNGITIAAGSGAPVYAVAAGKVVFADHLPGFGECVIVEHSAGYYTLYANLGRVFAARGTAVARGEILAEVAEALPHEETAELYFEIRRGKTPLDPARWLRARR
jgi:septal ring factor EnvC (AmiA/AmiB activator)